MNTSQSPSVPGRRSANIMYGFAFCLYLLGFSISSAHSRSLPSETDVRQIKAFEAFERKFLNMMGLKNKPRVKRDAVAPQYMQDLYNNLVKNEEYVTTNLEFRDFSTTANTVRSFYHTDMDDSGSNNTRRRVSLDIASIPLHEKIIKAEFRLFRNVSRNLTYARQIINVYQILQPGVGKQSVKRLLDSRVVDASTPAWESYDILKAVRDWRHRPAENHGLEVAIVSENGDPIDQSHLHFDRREELDEGMWSHRRPLAAVFTRDPNHHHHAKRVRRHSSLHRRSSGALCKRHDLHVNFHNHLQWKWVFAPTAYNAYFCRGDCVYPLAEHMNATNHAIVQTLVHNVKKHVPPACCIPTELEELPLLYQTEANNIILKRFSKMVVTGCGCR